MGSLVLDSDIPAIDAGDRKREETPVVFVNGKRRILPKDLAHLTLLEYLRSGFQSSLHYFALALVMFL